MEYSGFEFEKQNPEVLEVIDKYRLVKSFSEKEKTEILSALADVKYLRINTSTEPSTVMEKVYISISFLELLMQLDSLLYLDLSGTMIHRLPDSIGNLRNLLSLSLRNTAITHLPESIGELSNLQSFDLNRTDLEEVPDSIGKLHNLRDLTLRKTFITELPESISGLTGLQWLDLRLTQLTKLPDGIRELRSLQNLYLSETRIKELPPSIGELPNLKRLVLEDLELSELPESLLSLGLPFRMDEFTFYSPQGIYISNVKLKNQPIEIFSRSRELIAVNYHSNKQSSPINECKIVFLGDGGAGKTLIVDRLMHDGDFSPGFTGESTPGICISSKKFLIKGEQVALHFWDFGGQAIMHSMHRLFLTNRTLYVVVANARDNKANEQAWYWIRNIMSFANGAPVLLLVNQKDQNPSANVNQTGLQREYGGLKEVGIVSALKSSKEEFNTEVRDVICRIVSEMDTVHTPFSRAWLSLMNDLQYMPEEYITSDVFYEKCKESGIETDNNILDEIISWYQDLGVCFYSRKHPYTRQYMVLKPKWLLNALYILIFNGRKYASNGIIKEADIYRLICQPLPGDTSKKVWSDIRYKPFEIQYIINVLLNFELIYRLDGEHFFIPMLCDENEFEAMSGFMDEDTIHVSFEYVYLPENVLHCLMVRHGYELNTDMVWRTGAVFERKPCAWTALVRINGSMLDIYVRGDDRDKHPVNSYLDMIRESVYSINRDMGLGAEEFIAYREGDEEERFEYRVLTGSKEAGLDKIYSKVFKRLINIDEILGILINPRDRLTRETADYMLSALREMGERSVYLAGRGEVELTADFQSAVAPVLNAEYGIQTAREYTLGRSKKKIGETDLYFYRYREGIKEELFILENKYIEKFRDQYLQLMGYLNPDFAAGFTLSINREKGWEEAFDYICQKLEQLKSDGGSFAPVLIERRTESKRTQCVMTRHIVPETGMTMSVYHLVLQLSDKDRHGIAIKARE